ncbi:MAG: HD domain-containing protein [Candidatus Omnitrophica bacterium]|nr:HD domain-containing protein [Candidatus Omnitrophota bacterium]
MNPSDYCLRDSYCKNCRKFNTSQCHPDVVVLKQGDSLKHTMMVLQNSKPGIENQLAALLHDAGKASTTELIDGAIHSYGHEKVSGEIAEAVCRRLKFDTDVIRNVRKIVENHMRPHALHDAGTAGIRKFIREVGEELVDAVVDLAAADKQGKIPKGNNIPSIREKIEKVKAIKPVTKNDSILDGLEIMKILDIKPGPKIKEVMSFLEEKGDEWIEKGKVLDKETAMNLILEKFKGV